MTWMLVQGSRPGLMPVSIPLQSHVAIFSGQSNDVGGNFDTTGQSLLAALGSGGSQGWLYPPTAGVNSNLQIFTPNQATINTGNTPVWTTGTSTGFFTSLLNGWNNLNCSYPAPTAYPTTSSVSFQNWGPEAEFSWMWGKTFPGLSLYIIKFAVSGTQLAVNGGGTDWNPASSGKLFDALVDVCSKALALLSNPVISVFQWDQGENDAQNSTSAASYQTNLGAFISAVRTRIDGGRQTPFCITRINNVAGYSSGATVQAAQDAYANVAGCIVIHTDAYPLQGDNVHYTATGQTCIVANMGVLPASGGHGSDIFNACRTAGFF